MILAGICAYALTFSLVGPDCTPTNQLVECRCSEGMTWQPASGAVTKSYRITRTDSGGTVHVGWLMSGLDEDGNWLPPPTTWTFAKHDNLLLDNHDNPDISPLEGRTYTYTIAACNDYGCSPESSPVKYVAAPYAYTFRPPAQGN